MFLYVYKIILIHKLIQRNDEQPGKNLVMVKTDHEDLTQLNVLTLTQTFVQLN